jgi:predicted membrane protein
MTSRVAVGAILLATGVVWLLATLDVITLTYRAWIGIVLIAIGLTIMLLPERHGTLVLLGVLVAVAGAPALLVDGDVLAGGIGERTETLASAAELEPLRQGIGKLTIDLSSLAVDAEHPLLQASVGIGELVVLVPSGSDVSVDAHAGIGSIETPDESTGGIDVDLETSIHGEIGGEIWLELDVGIGAIRVEQR